MTSRNIIFGLFLIIILWFAYLSSTFTDEFLDYTGRNKILTRYTPWFNLILMVISFVFMVKKNALGTLVLLIAAVIHILYELALGEMHFFVLLYAWAIYTLVTIYSKTFNSEEVTKTQEQT